MLLKQIISAFFFSGLLAQASCSKVIAPVFGNQTPREQYERQLDKNDLDETPEGRRWLAASEAALAHPVSISIPYKQKGAFPDTLQVALGLQFQARRGEKITFTIDKKEQQSFALYADLFVQDGTGKPSLQYSADTTDTAFSYDIETAGTYLLRLQPELLKGGQYTLSISGGPSIGFPVTDPKAHIGSFWGAPRDGGKRNHEGIDIFAKKGSPAVAAMDGTITNVNEVGIGGKVVWLRPTGKDYVLYYAHLDAQTVQTGQQVSKGDQLGTVGNTGNARTTPAHLHFGVYTFNGAVDPLPFVQRQGKKAGTVPAKSLAGVLKVIKAPKSSTLKPNSLLTPIGLNNEGYLAVQPDGNVVLTPFTAVKLVTNADASTAPTALRREAKTKNAL